jgi:hypothetical protein
LEFSNGSTGETLSLGMKAGRPERAIMICFRYLQTVMALKWKTEHLQAGKDAQHSLESSWISC